VFITRRFPLFLMETPEDGGQAPNAETPDTPAEPGTEQQPVDVDWAKRYSDLQPEYTRAPRKPHSFAAPTSCTRRCFPRTPTPAARRPTSSDSRSTRTQRRHPGPAGRPAPRTAVPQGGIHAAADPGPAAAAARRNGAARRKPDGRSTAQGRCCARLDRVACRGAPPTPDGMPDIRAAHSEFEALMTAQKKQWANTKRTQHISPVGQAGTQTPDLHSMTRDERHSWMAERYRALTEQ
jgi:hypothetical protein